MAGGRVCEQKGRALCVLHPQEAELKRLEQVQAQEVQAQRARAEVEAARAQALADVEASRVREVAKALGPDTIRDIARAGPELQVSRAWPKRGVAIWWEAWHQVWALGGVEAAEAGLWLGGVGSMGAGGALWVLSLRGQAVGRGLHGAGSPWGRSEWGSSSRRTGLPGGSACLDLPEGVWSARVVVCWEG